jgi:hypothetical protein
MNYIFLNVLKFRYLGTTITNKLIYDDIRNTISSGMQVSIDSGNRCHPMHLLKC